MVDKSADLENDVMTVQFVLLFLSRAFSAKRLKTFNIFVKNKSAPIFHGLYALIDHRNMIEMTYEKCSKLGVLNKYRP